MAIVNITNPVVNYNSGQDSISIVDNLQSLRGGRSLDVTGFTPTTIRAGHVIIYQTATRQYKPMPITGVNSIGALGLVTEGTGYTNGYYAGVALTGGTGTGATANITVTGGKVSAVVIVAKGTGFTAGDVLSALVANIGGTGTGFTVSVSAVSEGGAYAALPAGHVYAGILINSVLTTKPFAGIMVRGNVNPVAAPYDFETIRAAFMTATGNLITAIAD